VNQFNRAASGNWSYWPHRVAVVLVCATFPLIWVGGLVTTYEAGMAVPDWPSTYGYNLFLYPWSTWLSGPWDLMIEHGHRLMASAVGLITIALVIVTWWCDKRPWARWYMGFGLGLVIAQGVLGGMRVLMDATLLARVHGCLGPVFFVCSVVAAAITSSWWRDGSTVEGVVEAASFRRFVWITAGIAYLQLVLGAHLRHLSPTWSPGVFRVVVYAHLLGASILTIHVTFLLWKVVTCAPLRRCRLLFFPTVATALLLGLQLMVGAGTWRLKYHWPSWLPQTEAWRGFTVSAEGMLQTVTITAHVALGSLIVAMLVLAALRASKMLTTEISELPIGNAVRLKEVLI
jgi:cytochrome c oxidase assembly protein subunit 15